MAKEIDPNQDIIDILDAKYEAYFENAPSNVRELVQEYTGHNWSVFALAFYKSAIKKYPFKKEDLKPYIKEIKRHHKFNLDDILSRTEKLSNSETKLFIETINKISLPCDIVVYRGVKKDLFLKTILKNGESVNEVSIGDTISNIVPWSTSLKKKQAKVFSRNGIMLEIHLSDETKGLWLSPLSYVKGEQELLLPNESSYIVIDTKYDKEFDEDLTKKDEDNYIILKHVKK